MAIGNSILKNGVSSVIQKSVKIAEQLLLVPFFIQFWGAAYYGEWLTLTVVPSMLALSDFGLGSAAANSFLLKYAAGSKQEAANIAKTGTIILTVHIVFAILLSIGIIQLLKYYGVFNKSLINAHEAITAILILLTARIINFYQALSESFFRAARRADISINFQTLIALSNIIAGLIVLFTGGKANHYAFAMLTVVLIFNPIYIFTGRRLLGLYKTHQGIVDKQLIKPLIQTGFGYFLSPIWQAIYYQGMTFVVRLTLGPIAVTTFNTTRTLVRSSAQAFGMAITSVYPDFQFELGAGNTKKAMNIFLGVILVNITIALLSIVTLSLFGESLYNWWTKNSLIMPQSVWLIFLASILFYALWFSFSFIFEASNKPYTNTVAGLVCSSISVGLSWLLSKQIGLIGMAIGCLLFDILMCIFLIRKGNRYLNISMKDIKSLGDLILNILLKAKKQLDAKY